jgi:predicted TIM-barrel fold metal-dependent hydrolase
MTLAGEQMSARSIGLKAAAPESLPRLLVSADSHVDEPLDLWDGLPLALREQMPKRVAFAKGQRPEGGMDPRARITDMDLDGVAAEILYPTAALRLFALPQEVQEAAFRVYNDWVASYCRTSPKRLFAVPALSVYDIDWAIAEMRRCHDMGLIGALIWQVPDPALPLTAPHYDKFWAAAADMNAPVNFHILTGHNYARANPAGLDRVRGSVNTKIADAVTTVFDLIWSGVFERHPKLKVEIVEAEIGWIPFVLQQWDYYHQRFIKPGARAEKFPITRRPSAIFADHVFATFMDDEVGARAFSHWGEKNCMWSSDYPHPNMTWPHSRAFLEKQIGGLERVKQERLLSRNVIELYHLPVDARAAVGV